MKNKDDDISRGRRVTDYSVAAIEQTESYCRAHPDSPAAVRRPQLIFRGELWIAVLGPSVEEGIVGIGPTVAAALRAFDAQYLTGLRPPPKAFRAARHPSQSRSKRCRRSCILHDPRSTLFEPFELSDGSIRIKMRARAAQKIGTTVPTP
jgi:hypothetical protein